MKIRMCRCKAEPETRELYGRYNTFCRFCGRSAQWEETEAAAIASWNLDMLESTEVLRLERKLKHARAGRDKAIAELRVMQKYLCHGAWKIMRNERDMWEEIAHDYRAELARVKGEGNE